MILKISIIYERATFKTSVVPPPPVPPTPSSNTPCFYHWIAVAFTIVNIIAFVLLKFIFKRKNLTIIACAISSVLALVFAIVGASLTSCAICIAFIVISIILLAAELVISYLTKNKNDNDDNDEAKIDNKEQLIDIKDSDNKQIEIKEEQIDVKSSNKKQPKK